MALTGLNQLLTNQYLNIPLYFVGNTLNATAASLFITQNPYPGSRPPSYSGGTGGFACDINTSGGLLYGKSFTGDLYITEADTTPANTAGTLTVVTNSYIGYVLCDRLWACSDFKFNTTGVQTVISGGVLPARDMYGTTSGFGCEIWLEGYTQNATNSSIITITYTDSYGNTGQTGTASYNNWSNSNNTRPVLMNGYGVRSIESIQISATGSPTGNLGVTILRRIMDMPNDTRWDKASDLSYLSLGIPKLNNSGCYYFIENALRNPNVGNVSVPTTFVNLKMSLI